MTRAGHVTRAAVLFAAAALVAGRAVAAEAPATKKVVKAGTFCETQDAKACQDAVTPQLVLDRFKRGNERFASGHSTRRDYLRQVHATVQMIRDESPVLREMEQKGEILVVGAMYDVETGKVTWSDAPGAAPSAPVKRD
jgi:hypothetical protein